jgi:Tfp pilus assembly protein PilX
VEDLMNDATAKDFRRERGQTLVASLIVIVIILLLAVVVMKGTLGEKKSTREDGRGVTVQGAALAAADDTRCKSNLGQVRMSLGMLITQDDVYPASIEETRLGEAFYRCPLGKEPYSYNSADGTVKCPHKGHEEY